jgi:hypothetical protein
VRSRERSRQAQGQPRAERNDRHQHLLHAILLPEATK